MDAIADDLTRPLGLDRPKAGPGLSRLVGLAAPVLGVLIGGAAVALAVFVALVDDPLGGEPHAVSAITAAPSMAAKPPSSQVKDVSPEPASRTAAELEGLSGVSVTRGEGQGAPGSVVIRVPDPPGPIRLAPAPDARLVERSRHGTLPKVGPDGARPSTVYARPAPAALPGGAASVGRIALLVGGLGISPGVTAEAIAKLPAPVTLAFAPYGGSALDGLVAKAREAGHEVMLQAPMEPFDYPDSDPGPHTLLAKAPAKENLERLHWVMARFSGYTGLVNFMGARLTSDEAALAPFLRELAARGLAVVDDGSSSRSVLGATARAAGIPAARADIVLDASPRAELIDRELQRLEELARKQGLAVGSANALPMTVERIARWSKSLENRGILLVPVSAAFAAPSPR